SRTMNRITILLIRNGAFWLSYADPARLNVVNHVSSNQERVHRTRRVIGISRQPRPPAQHPGEVDQPYADRLQAGPAPVSSLRSLHGRAGVSHASWRELIDELGYWACSR